MQSSSQNATPEEATAPPPTTSVAPIDHLHHSKQQRADNVKATDQPPIRKRPVATSINGVAAAAEAASDQMSMRQSSSSTTPKPARSDSARQDIVVELRRNKRPSSDGSRRSSSANEESEQNLQTGNREISDEESSVKRISFSAAGTNSSDANQSEPLIHTDKLNATSPLLYVYPPKRQKHRHHHRDRQQSRIQTSNSRFDQTDQDQAAESSMSSAQLATLSATGPPLAADRLVGPDSLSNRSDQPARLVPRLVVLNLEVGSSTATLTWTLSLFPIDESQTSNESSLAASVSSKPSKRDDKAAAAKQVTSVIGSARQSFDDKPAGSRDEQNSPVEPIPLAINESDLEHQKGPAARVNTGRQQKRRSDKGSADRAVSGWSDATSPAVAADDEGLVGSTESSGSSYGSSRLIVKRDTIKVTPTLNRQSEPAPPVDDRNKQRPGRELSGDKRAHRGHQQANERAAEASRASDLFSSTGAQEDEGHMDLMRTKSDADAAPSSTRSSTSTTTTTTTAEPANELSVGQRLQLSRNLLQSLHGTGHNRRPPLRSISNDNSLDGPASPMAESRGAFRSTEASEAVASSSQPSITRTTAADWSEARRPLRFVSRRKAKPSSTTTTTTTSTPDPLLELALKDEGREEAADDEESSLRTTKAPRTAKSMSPEGPITTAAPVGPTVGVPTTESLSKESSIEPRDPPVLEVESTTKSVQLVEPPASGSPLSPGNMIKQQQVASAVSSATAESALPARSSPTDSSPPASDPNNKPAEVSKWLVRLRRFASNEVDIVKVLVNNLGQIGANGRQQAKPSLRYITFRELEPSSAYELCIESASPNQQVGDKFQVLDANHFLKCFDSSDVELSSRGAATSGSDSIRRMDFNPAIELEQFESAGNNSQPNPVEAMPLIETGVKLGNDHHRTSDAPQAKIKSLCKEFLTLPANSTERINFGQYDARQAGNNNRISSPTSARNSQQQTSPEMTNTFSQQWSNNSNVGNPRRAKSLNNALKSRMELLEINDFNEQSAQNRPQSMVFEMVASRATGGRLTPIGSDNSYVTKIAPATDLSSGAGPQNGGTLSTAAGHNSRDYMTMSLLPILGCIFGIIFIITLANIILSAISCRSLRARRRRAAGAGLATRSGMLSHSAGQLPPITGRSSSKHTLGSFYGSDSDHSGTSQSRIVVVGKNGEPFGAGSAYFEVPNDSRARLAEQSSLAGSSNGSGGKHSSSFLLSNSTRFPLGPSFEGDEKHNADMVGLARKNYDNFINHIYNNGPQTEQAGVSTHKTSTAANQLTLMPHQDQADHRQPGHRHHRHRHHHHHHHQRHPNQLNGTENQTWHPNRSNLDDSRQQVDVRHGENLPTDQNTTSKRQRIRFDKINPIYNMDGLYSTSTGVVSSTRRLKSPLGVSTFGHTNPAQILEEGDERSVSTSGDEFDGQCPLCLAELNQAGSLDKNSHQQLEDSGHCDAGENCEEQAYFTCCLDKQKQRFNKQQQQLERVLTKNGSLVPQPFINPIGPPRCGSPSCESIVREHDQQRAAAADPQQQQVSNLSPAARDKPSSSHFDATDLISQNDKEDQEVIEVSKKDQGDPTNDSGPNDFFIFGEQNSDGHESDGHRMRADNGQTPSPPVPPSPLPASTPTPDKDSHRKAQVTVVPMGQGVNDPRMAPYGAINKTDFNQRRTELASKLNLAGMTKPS